MIYQTFIQEILLSTLIFVGLPAGFFLAKLAEEEILAGKTFFELLRLLLFLIMLTLPSLSARIFSLIIVVLALLLFFKNLEYLMLGAFLPLMSGELLIVQSTLILLYGFVIGTFEYASRPHNASIFTAIKNLLLKYQWALYITIFSFLLIRIF